MKKLELPNKFQIPKLTRFELDCLSYRYDIQIKEVTELKGGIMNRVYSINNSIAIKKVNPIYNPSKVLKSISDQSLLSKSTSCVAEVLQTKDGEYVHNINGMLFYATKIYKGKDPSINDTKTIIDNIQIIHSHFNRDNKKISISSTMYSDLELVLKHLKGFGAIYQINISSLEILINNLLKEIIELQWQSESTWIHGDPTIKNIIKFDDSLIFIDFDRAGMKSEIEDWGRFLCSVGLITPTNKIIEKSIFTNSYNTGLFFTSLDIIKDCLYEEIIYDWLVFYCQFFTIRRSVWEIIQEEMPMSQDKFDLFSTNTLEKYYQLKNAYE